MPAETALLACEALIEQWHGVDDGRLRFCVTPRFALSCTPDLLRRAGALAARYDLPVQTHLSETLDEIAAVAQAFPGHTSYLDVYAAFGLVGSRTVLGHCVHLSATEWDALAASGAAVAHCPDSNAFLGSGVMSLADATARGVRVGLGTDVGAGRSFSLRRTCSAAYDAALSRGARIGPDEALWLATVGGARALGLEAEVGLLEPGFACDLAAHDVPVGLDTDALFDHLAFRAEVGSVKNVYVRGRRAV
jgi:guanine deaminase